MTYLKMTYLCACFIASQDKINEIVITFKT